MGRVLVWSGPPRYVEARSEQLGYNGNSSGWGDFYQEELPAPENAEDYTPRITMSQGITRASNFGGIYGNVFDSPQLAIVRRRVDGTTGVLPVAVIGRSERWQITLDTTGVGFDTLRFADGNVTLDGGAAPNAVEALQLGLTHDPICVRDDYGPCTLGIIDRFFHVAYPQSGLSPSPQTSGQAFVH